MSKISKIKKISLSTVLVSILAGCGGGGGGGSASTSTQSGSNSNLSANSVTYDSCVDLNMNLTCEEGEKNLNPSSYPEVAVTSKENNGKYLIGPAGTSTVSASSTLIYNEMKYNPLVENNEQKAKEYISTKLNGNTLSANAVSNDDLLTEQQSKDLEDSIKDAITANPLLNRNTVIAAVCEKFLSKKAKVSVSSSDITKQTRVLTTINPTKFHEIDWNNETTADLVGEIKDQVDADLVKKQGGERIVSLHGNGNYQVSASQYHNALTVINFNDASKQHQYEKFAAFRVNYNTGQGGTATPSTGSSSGGDIGGGSGSTGSSASSGGSARMLSANSVQMSVQSVNLSAQAQSSSSDYTVNTDPNNSKGLWEHLLEDAKITKDGKYVFALIRSKDESVKYPDESTYGFFRTEVGPYGVYPYNASSTLRIHSKDISKFELSNSDNRVIVYGQVTNDKDEKQNILRVHDQDFGLIKAVEIDNLSDFTITSTDALIVGHIKGDYINKPKLVTFNSTTLENKKEVELPFEGSEVFTYAHGTMAVVASKDANKIALVNLETMKVEQEKTLDINAELFSMSTNGKYLAVASEDKINIYNLSTPELTFQASISVDIANILTGEEHKDEKNSINNLSFVGDALLSYTQKQTRNKVSTYNIVDTKVPMTVDNKLNTALATLDKYSVNNGYEFSEVKNKLTLIPSYNDVNFTWTVSALQSNINLSNGEVTRDVNNNITGKLIATASTTFRDETSTKQKVFDVTILKDSPKITDNVVKFNQLHTVNTSGLMRKVIANSNASTIISYSELDDYFKGYNLFRTQNDQLVFTDGNSNSTNRLLRDNLLNMTFKTDEKIIVVTVNKHYPSFSSIYLQDVQSDNTLQEGYNTLPKSQAHIGNAGTPLSAGFSGDKNKVIVIRKHHDFDYSDHYADVYKISGDKITLEEKIRMKPGVDYVNTNAPAVNNDGSIFYQIDKNNIYKQQAETITSVRLDNVSAVYYYNSRVYATTSKGLIVSYNENLEDSSKQEFNIGNEGEINNLEFRVNGAQNYIYAFASNTNSGVYIIKVSDSSEMSEFKFSAKANTKGGTVSGDGEHIFTFENVPTAYQSSTSSNLSYSKSNQ